MVGEKFDSKTFCEQTRYFQIFGLCVRVCPEHTAEIVSAGGSGGIIMDVGEDGDKSPSPERNRWLKK